MERRFEKKPIWGPREDQERDQKERIKLQTKILPMEGMDERFLPTFKTPEEREKYLKVLEGAREVGRNRERFWNMLVSTVERAGYKPPPQERQTTILNLGCGKCEEGKVLSAFFGGENFGFSSENVKLIGVDINQKAIERATRNHLMPDFSEEIMKYVLPSNYEFIVGDATSLDQYQQIPKEVDVVVIRHQRISESEQTWTKIFQQAIQRVSRDGIIIITSFSDIEHEMLIKALQKLDCEIVINESNPHAKPLPDEEISLDRNVAIIRKKSLPPK